MLKYSILTIILLALHCRSGYSESRAAKRYSESRAEKPYSESRAEKQCDKIKENYKVSMGDYIAGGREASSGELPYMVALAVGLKTGNRYQCGASLVSKTCIVTAAHCMDTDPNEPIIVRIGTTDISDTKWNPKTDHKIAKIVIHPQYNNTMFYNDIAVLKLNSPVALSSNVYPICLNTNKADPKGQLVVSGWGFTRRYDVKMQTHLRLTTVEAISNKNCESSYREDKDYKLPFGITSGLLCAKGKGRANACPGDSGGPVVLPGKDGASTLVGVTSFGKACDISYPVGYTRISSYVDWIAETCDFPN